MEQAMNDVAMELADTSRGRKSTKRAQPPVHDLRDWLARVERIRELVRVPKPVDRDEEMSAISYLIAKNQPSPAILFEQARGFESSPSTASTWAG